ncbi:uncharacterized protein LOC100838166 [Brachypodium distachyon]|uniref:Hexosyltransferase n=1 Tax=Brachypodium distachyon TaxID=15368 RepID=I1HG25_BRADI|nr:uncharacterized protein LOC100838166 [Brachypodium distachyon]KQK04709.1 hypothetical protein BRADI_2g15440v3 [Brachypodium distachyon]|eukprot:XP_003565857.1 uncharacterized protein LOC100838166 [Brachypodium distachyon]
MKKLSSPFAQLPFFTAPILLVPFLLLALIYFLLFPNGFNLQSGLLAPCQCNTCPATTTTTTPAKLATPAVDLRVLLGVLTVPSSYERRALLRLAYKLQPPPTGAVVDVRFVFCNVTKEEDAVLVALEIIAYDDILVLNCTENMNDGKTFDFFSAVPKLFADKDPPYDYVGKADDDTYYRMSALADALRSKPRRRHDVYHGFLWPCDLESPNPEWQFMVGWGYVVSWDVAAWISSEPGERMSRNYTKGAEDMAFRHWLRLGGKGKNMYGEGKRMYDYLDGEKPDREKSCYRHELVPDTVAVHRLKSRLWWARTLRFFNSTEGFKPSKMYHLDF